MHTGLCEIDLFVNGQDIQSHTLKMKTKHYFNPTSWHSGTLANLFSLAVLAACLPFVNSALSTLQINAVEMGSGVASFCFKAVIFKMSRVSPFNLHSLKLLFIKIRSFLFEQILLYCFLDWSSILPSRITLSVFNTLVQFIQTCLFPDDVSRKENKLDKYEKRKKKS